MGRRRPSSKSKAGAKPRPVDRKDSKIKRWNKRSDIELDEEDQFHESRDKITLGEGSDGDDDDFGEDEVFALHGISDDDEDDADGLEDGSDVDMEDEKVAPKKPRTPKSKSKKAKKDASPPPVEEEEETWGRGKRAYYSSNAAEIGSDDEEAQKMEEQEARRLQTKAREGMTDEDFGLGEVIEGDVQPEEAGETLDVASPTVKDVPKDKQSLLRFLERENPETLALARDWDNSAQSLMEAKARIEALKGPEANAMELGLQHLYYQALLTYMTTLAFYLHMRASDKYAARPQVLRSHPILKRLLTLKQSINMLENIGVHQDLTDEDDDEDEMDSLDLELGLDPEPDEGEGETLWDRIMKQGLESDELADLIRDAEMSSPPSSPKRKASEKKTSKSSAIKEETSGPSSSSIDSKPPKKKRKTAVDGPSIPVFDLIEPDFTPSKKSKNKSKGATVPVDDSDTLVDPYGEVTTLSYADAHDKQARKKSLRFHVSRIESSSARRQSARTKAVGGDDDIPYRERRKERETRLEKERQQQQQKDKKLGMGGDDLDDVDPEFGSHAVPSDIIMSHKSKKRRRGMEDGDGGAGGGQESDAMGYYDLVRSAVASKKAKKKADYEAAVAASRPEIEDDKSSGPRSITRAILKNKGLTPQRSKSVRNPRVKKRQKYEKAKKKVSSQRAVYKGGIGDISRYEGEKSGISKVAKSVPLG